MNIWSQKTRCSLKRGPGVNCPPLSFHLTGMSVVNYPNLSSHAMKMVSVSKSTDLLGFRAWSVVKQSKVVSQLYHEDQKPSLHLQVRISFMTGKNRQTTDVNSSVYKVSIFTAIARVMVLNKLLTLSIKPSKNNLQHAICMFLFA